MGSPAARKGVVTGGGSGIGRALALALVAAGHDVILCGRRLEALEETARRGTPPGRLSPLACDLTRREGIDALTRKIRARDGGIDFLVNNAGVSGMNPLEGDAAEDRWDVILETNLSAPYRIVKALAPAMQEGGRILNISSVLGKFGVAGYSAYCASKHGIIGLTRALALELAPRRITVNAICPGWVDTDMARSGMESISRRLGVPVERFHADAMARVPLGRMLQPEEIAPLALYLLSDAAGMMTGQAINLCGGATTA